jgi:hypothetical protein
MKVLDTRTGAVSVINKRKVRIKRLQRRIFAWSKRMQSFFERVGKDYRLVMIRLSYAGVDDWKPNHIREFMREGKRLLGENLKGYAWVAELQERGAVHYHVLMLVTRGTQIPKPDESGWWAHGYTRIQSARSPYYICTYTGKEYQKMGDFPKGLRMFAVWIRPGVISDDALWVFRLSAYPRWLVEGMWKDGIFRKIPKRMEGGGWQVGRHKYYSPFVLWEGDG